MLGGTKMELDNKTVLTQVIIKWNLKKEKLINNLVLFT